MTREGSPGPRSGPVRRTLFAFLVGALVGVPVGMVWSWFDYGSFELGYMSNHVTGAVLICGLVAAGLVALRSWFRRNPV